MAAPELILASASPRRQELLRFMGCPFSTRASHAEEIHNEDLTGTEVAQVNAYRKARSVARECPNALVLGADTVVHRGQRLFGKPTDREDACRMLMELQAQTHYVVTALCLIHLATHRHRMLWESTAVTFRPLTETQVRVYLSQMNPLDKAGAYAIQEKGEYLVASIEGSLTNVVGLPLELLAAELREWKLTW